MESVTVMQAAEWENEAQIFKVQTFFWLMQNVFLHCVDLMNKWLLIHHLLDQISIIKDEWNNMCHVSVLFLDMFLHFISYLLNESDVLLTFTYFFSLCLCIASLY